MKENTHCREEFEEQGENPWDGTIDEASKEQSR
jgi:hypothetical protein